MKLGLWGRECNSRRSITCTFRKDVERFRSSVMKSLFGFPNGKIIAVPATSLIAKNDFGEGHDAPGVLKNNFDVNKRSRRNDLHKILDSL